MSVAERLRARTPTRRWVGLGVAAAGWFAAYELNRPLWDWLVFDVVGLDPESRLGSGVHFFFYDSAKIALLLVGIIFVVTVLRSFMSVEEDVPRSVELRWRAWWSSCGDHGFIMTDGADSLGCDVLVEGGAERGQVQVAVDAAELLAGLDHPGG